MWNSAYCEEGRGPGSSKEGVCLLLATSTGHSLAPPTPALAWSRYSATAAAALPRSFRRRSVEALIGPLQAAPIGGRGKRLVLRGRAPRPSLDRRRRGAALPHQLEYWLRARGQRVRRPHHHRERRPVEAVQMKRPGRATRNSALSVWPVGPGLRVQVRPRSGPADRRFCGIRGSWLVRGWHSSCERRRREHLVATAGGTASWARELPGWRSGPLP
jgi:hypothetical protein